MCLSSLRRTARSTSLHGKIKVTLTDNLASLFGFERGRSSSWSLNQYCRAAASYAAATGIRWRIRHIETLRNPADKDSRFDKPVKRNQVYESKVNLPNFNLASVTNEVQKLDPRKSPKEAPKPAFWTRNLGLAGVGSLETNLERHLEIRQVNQVDEIQDNNYIGGLKSARLKAHPLSCIGKSYQTDPVQCDKPVDCFTHSLHSQSRTSSRKPAKVSEALQCSSSDKDIGGQSVEGGTSPGQGQHQSYPSDNPKSLSYKRGGLFLEVFSGSNCFTKAVVSEGGGVLTGIDFLQGPHHDLRRRSTQKVVLSWIRSGRVRYVHLGTPCTVFSAARYGIRNFQRAQDREREGLEFALFTAEVIETCNRYHVSWSLENPQRSKLFAVPLLSRQLQESHVRRFELDFCMYGEVYRKPTSIFTNLESLQALIRRCVHTKHQDILRGSERCFVGGKWTTAPKTKRAGAYPYELVVQWAQILCPLLTPSSRDTDLLKHQWDY